MKNTILKTSLITLGSIICILAITFGILSIFFPVVIGDVADKMGNYSVSISYYEKNYKKTQKIEDLYFLITKLNAKDDSYRTENYTKEMMKSDKFEKFIEKNDKELENDVVKTREFVSGKYAISAYKVSPFEVVINFCEDYVDYAKYKYVLNNPYTSLINARGREFTLEQLNVIKDKLNARKYSYSSTLNEYVKADIKVIESLIAEKTPA